MPYIYLLSGRALACATTVFACCCTPVLPELLQGGTPEHLEQAAVAANVDVVIPPPPLPLEQEVLYHVDVDGVSARELVWALVRDAALPTDLQAVPDMAVSLYAPGQPISLLLERIASLAGWRMDASHGQLLFAADEPYMQVYHIGYLDMARTASSRVQIANQIKSPSSDDGAGGGFEGNNSTTNVSSESLHDFWAVLDANLQALVANAADTSIVINASSGVVAVQARQSVHKMVAQFLSALRAGAYRQVLIEATIVEVALDDQFSSGIDWSLFEDSVFSIRAESFVPNEGTFIVEYKNGRPGFALNAMLSLLHDFGNTKVLSSPRLMALNNQTALLKVVDNVVYFTVDQQTTLSVQGNSESTASSVVHTVPVGLVMSITPHIDSDGAVILNVRPSISRINNFVDDPNPALGGTVNRVPQVRVRELESLLRLEDGQVAVLGGLMQDQADEQQRKIPGLSSLPLLGHLFTGSSTRTQRTELVVLLRPVVLRSAQERAL
ncbi:MAG: pilus (MSHA type) biogenesis protein MshL [Candidatus Porifericomitaceae bacterium WSBS_2022_MAG_OTU9]